MRLRPTQASATEIQQQTQQADQAETEVTQVPVRRQAPLRQRASCCAGCDLHPLQLGQTPDQVQAAMGAPARVANLGPKVIYYYSGMKVTFVNGKVSDVQ